MKTQNANIVIPINTHCWVSRNNWIVVVLFCKAVLFQATGEGIEVVMAVYFGEKPDHSSINEQCDTLDNRIPK